MYFKLSPKATAAMNRVIEKFKTGNLSPILDIARIVPDPEDDSPARHWSFNNQILALMTTGDLDARGFKQWKKVNRHVVANASAGYIWAPLTKWVEDDDGEKRKVTTGFKAIPVFGLSATDGEPLPDFDYSPKDLPALTDLADQLDVTVEWKPLPADRLGDCTTDGQKIRIGTHNPEVFWHELAHSLHTRTGHKKETAGQDPHRETVAEFTACVLAQLYGDDDVTGKTWQYISHYNPTNPLAAIHAALDEVTGIMAEIEKMQEKPA